MATVKSFSYSDQNSAVASWVKEQKSLSQSLEIAIKMAIAQYGVCDLAEKRDQLFAQGAGVQVPVIKQSVPLNDADVDTPQHETKQEPSEANDVSADKEAPKDMPDNQPHDDPSASTAQTQEPENTNNDDSDLDLSFLDLKQ